jgi:hypothetical protein
MRRLLVQAALFLFIDRFPSMEDIRGFFFTAGQLRETSFYFRSSTMRALFQIVSSAGSDGGAFRSEQWTAHPSFNGLRDLAKEVFPSL